VRYNKEVRDITVGKLRKFFERLMSGAADADIAFDDLCWLLRRCGFNERIRGDHHIFTKDGVEEILNLQPTGSQAKPYQVKQVRNVIRKYNLDIEDVE
jgi:hypothetical protein